MSHVRATITLCLAFSAVPGLGEEAEVLDPNWALGPFQDASYWAVQEEYVDNVGLAKCAGRPRLEGDESETAWCWFETACDTHMIQLVWKAEVERGGIDERPLLIQLSEDCPVMMSVSALKRAQTLDLGRDTND